MSGISYAGSAQDNSPDGKKQRFVGQDNCKEHGKSGRKALLAGRNMDLGQGCKYRPY